MSSPGPHAWSGSLNPDYPESPTTPITEKTRLLSSDAVPNENYGEEADFEPGTATSTCFFFFFLFCFYLLSLCKNMDIVPLTIANMANTVVGSGIIGLPSALNQAGLGLGLILLVFVGVLTEFSLDILLVVGRLTRKYEYPDVFGHVFGKIGFVVANLTLMLNSAGGCLSYFGIQSLRHYVRF